MNYLAWCAAVLFLLTGCGAHSITRSPVASGSITTTASDRIRVIESADGSLEGHTYSGSGRLLAGRIVQALQGSFVDVALIPTTDAVEGLDKARASQARYLVVPTILYWEDRNSKWSMMPDRVSIQLVLRDSTSDTAINAVTFEAQSRRQFINGNPPPERLLNRNFDRAVRELLQR